MGFDNQTEDTTIDMGINDKLDGTRGTYCDHGQLVSEVNHKNGKR